MWSSGEGDMDNLHHYEQIHSMLYCYHFVQQTISETFNNTTSPIQNNSPSKAYEHKTDKYVQWFTLTLEQEQR
jgi:hypothetical protein